MSQSGGRIIVEDAYAQSKMIRSDFWGGKLSRGITPSDVDWVFDNAGDVLVTEFSKQTCDWGKLAPGQRMMYESLLRQPPKVAALCKHSVPTNRQICSGTDVDAFSLLLVAGGRLVRLGPIPGAKWQGFIASWNRDSQQCLQKLQATARRQNVQLF